MPTVYACGTCHHTYTTIQQLRKHQRLMSARHGIKHEGYDTVETRMDPRFTIGDTF